MLRGCLAFPTRNDYTHKSMGYALSVFCGQFSIEHFRSLAASSVPASSLNVQGFARVGICVNQQQTGDIL